MARDDHGVGPEMKPVNWEDTAGPHTVSFAGISFTAASHKEAWQAMRMIDRAYHLGSVHKHELMQERVMAALHDVPTLSKLLQEGG